VLAIIRPDSWNLALLVHVGGAMVLVGGVFTALAALLLSWRAAPGGRDVAAYARLAFRALLFGALPGWIVMRIGAEWIYSKEGWADSADEPAWLGFGYITADGGGFFLLLSLIIGGLGARRLARGSGERSVLTRIATVLVAVLLAFCLVAVWAMSAKPD
jgi:hypothetical protein